jgi:hypothetical protein
VYCLGRCLIGSGQGSGYDPCIILLFQRLFFAFQNSLLRVHSRIHRLRLCKRPISLRLTEGRMHMNATSLFCAHSVQPSPPARPAKRRPVPPRSMQLPVSAWHSPRLPGTRKHYPVRLTLSAPRTLDTRPLSQAIQAIRQREKSTPIALSQVYW